MSAISRCGRRAHTRAAARAPVSPLPFGSRARALTLFADSIAHVPTLLQDLAVGSFFGVPKMDSWEVAQRKLSGTSFAGKAAGNPGQQMWQKLLDKIELVEGDEALREAEVTAAQQELKIAVEALHPMEARDRTSRPRTPPAPLQPARAPHSRDTAPPRCPPPSSSVPSTKAPPRLGSSS